jgi:phosphoglycolate phosphatase-like HAD superfamily hydrolase
MMPAYPFLFIDLDGTITDSIRGVLNAVEYALARIGRPYPGRTRLHDGTAAP